jgi:acylphosphatase
VDEVLHIVVRGQVQGVGFRFHAEAAARRHGVAGWVRNLPSGAVEILARVPADRKAGFLADIRRGPPLAIVTGVDIGPAPAGLNCPAAGFSVRR